MEEKKRNPALLLFLSIVFLGLIFIPLYSLSTYNYINSGGTLFSYNGYNLTGSDGAVNRTLSLTRTPKSIVVDGWELTEDLDYIYTNETVTFLNKKWNEQSILITI